MLETLRKTFQNPQDEFSPIPFWFWNDQLSKAEITRQIHDFKEKGVMGFVIHPRKGIPKEIPYLSDIFMDYVKHAVEEAASHHMKVVLYDEAMYPSGSAHGMVVENNPLHAARCLRMEKVLTLGSGTNLVLDSYLEENETLVSVQAIERDSKGIIIPETSLILNKNNNHLAFQAPSTGNWDILLFIECFSRGTIRGIHFGEDDWEENTPMAGDLLNPDAMAQFIHFTHERYYEVLKDYFGSTIIAMFTDEPDVLGRGPIPHTIPWTQDFLKWYLEHQGKESDLPYLWFPKDPNSASIEKTFQKAVHKKLEVSYYKQISDWCEEHHIALTGHPAKSDDIGFLKYFHIPGQDVVWRWVAPEDNLGISGTHSTMGKCSSDAARHMGRRRNSNECFGCCGPKGIHWAFTADDMKWYLDWMFLRGVNLLYPHAFYYSIDGIERYGERPPDVGPNNVWWKYYKDISDYIKRMSWLMTDSVNITSIAVLCEEDYLPYESTKFLFQNQIEFNYLEDNLLLSDSCTITKGQLLIQKQIYNTIIIEDSISLRQEVQEKLTAFKNTGGTILTNQQEARSRLQGNLFSPPNPDLRISHVVKENCHFYLLVNEGESRIEGDIHILEYGKLELWDAWKGTCQEADELYWNGQTMYTPIQLDRRESIILCIDTKFAPNITSPMNKQHNTVLKQLTLSDKLESWTSQPGMEHFTGTLSYTYQFTLDHTNNYHSLFLDLGEVHDIAEVTINEHAPIHKLWKPFRFDITDYAVTGRNTIKIDVTNSMANHLCQESLPSGLIGPVILSFL